MKHLSREKFEGRSLLQVSCEVRREEAGFTLVEVAVAVAVGLVVIGLAYGAYRGAQRFGARWEDRLEAQNALHVMLRRFSADVRAAEHVGGFSESGIDLAVAPGAVAPGAMAEGSALRYRWKEQALSRNGRLLHGPEVQVVAATFSARAPEGAAGLVETAGGGERDLSGARALLTLRLTVEVGGDTLSGGAQAALRHPSAWTREAATQSSSPNFPSPQSAGGSR